MRFRKVRVGGKDETLAGAEPSGLAATVEPPARRAGRSPVSIRTGSSSTARPPRDYGVHVGDRLSVQFAATGFRDLRVAGIYNQEDFIGGFPVPFIVSRSTYETRVRPADAGAGPLREVEVAGRRRADRRSSYARRCTTTSRTSTCSRVPATATTRSAPIDRFLAVTVALLLLSEIIAVLGIVNTLALSVFERTRELGLLRAVGMSRVQVRQMVRGESVIIALLGGVVGAGSACSGAGRSRTR